MKSKKSELRLVCLVERKNRFLPRFVVIPGRVIAPWGLSRTTVIDGAINRIPMGRRPIKPWGKNRWFIHLPEALCKRAKIEQGDRVELVLHLASAALPGELDDALASNSEAQKNWQSLSVSRRRLLREYVTTARQPATRRRRAASVINQLCCGSAAS